MKTDLEMTNEILRQVRERRAAQKKRRLALGTSAGALAVAVAAVGIVYGTALHRRPDTETTACTEPFTSSALGTVSESAPQSGGVPETVADGSGGGVPAAIIKPPAPQNGEETTTSAVSAPPLETTVGVTGGPVTAIAATAVEPGGPTVTSQAAEPSATTQNLTTGGFLSGGDSPLSALPEKKAREQLVRSGEKLTDKQAQSYFKENLSWLQSALSASGVPAENLHVSARGYCHVTTELAATPQTDVTSGEIAAGGSMPVCALHQNFRDYPVWNENELVAIVTLVSENGELYATPAFGGPWFSAFGDFLNMHKGEKLLFLYFGGQAEYVLTPDGKVRNVQGQELAPDFGGIENPYDFFYCPEAIYIP